MYQLDATAIDYSYMFSTRAHFMPRECALGHTFGLTLADIQEIKMKLVKMLAGLVVTVTLVFVLTGCPSDTCTTNQDGSVSCNGSGGGGGGGDIGNDDPGRYPEYKPYHPPEVYRP